MTYLLLLPSLLWSKSLTVVCFPSFCFGGSCCSVHPDRVTTDWRYFLCWRRSSMRTADLFDQFFIVFCMFMLLLAVWQTMKTICQPLTWYNDFTYWLLQLCHRALLKCCAVVDDNLLIIKLNVQTKAKRSVEIPALARRSHVKHVFWSRRALQSYKSEFLWE